jgi:fibronectin type 3 domain-containing protein
MLISAIGAAALLTGPTASQAATLTFSPSADSYVDASQPDTNFGGLQKIRTDGSPVVRSYLRFDVTGFSGSVQKATLSLVPASSLSGAVTASAVADNSWSETTITNTNAPATGTTLSSVPSAVTGTPMSFDVTKAVPGNGPVSIALTSSSVTALAIWSREAGGTNVPQLVVDVQTDTTAPSAPDGLTATGGDKQVSLTWNAASDDTGVTGYRVYRQNADGSWPTTATATTAAATRSFTDTGRTNGTAYTYRVTAIDAAGNESAPSATASATPQAPPDTTAPSAPGGLTATSGDTKVTLSWSASTDNVGVASYRIYRQNADGSWPLTSTGNTPSATRTFTDSGLTDGTAYTYRVTAIDAAGNESAPSATASATPQAAPPPQGPCGTASAPPANWQHVVWIVMENHAYNQVVNSSSAPYENSLAAQCGLATNSFAITHPSLPNYIAMTSGSPQGVTDDNPPSSHPLNVPSIFSQLGSGGWRSLQESMPSNCLLGNSGQYAVKHNPAAYYTNIRTDCQNFDVPLGATPDISAPYTFVTPNLCNDTHDCSVGTGDTWLQTFIPKLTSTAEYKSGTTAIFLTWDEDDMTTVNQIATFVISPSTVPGTKSATKFTHYSLLRTTEEMFGITNFLGGAASATSMRSAFNL